MPNWSSSVVMRLIQSRGVALLPEAAARLRMAFGLLAFLACLSPCALSQEWSWTTSQVDVEGTQSSVAVDHAGNVHVSYGLQGGGKLKYAFLPAGSTHWFNLTVDSGLGDFLTRITLDRNSNPYICYTPGVLKLAEFNGKQWSAQTIDPGSGLVSYYCSIQFSPDGTPHLSWYVESRPALRYAVLQDGVWKARDADTQDYPGKYNSMAIDPSGFPVLSYIGLTGTKLKYARFDGQDWTRLILEAPFQGLSRSQGDTGMGTSIALDSAGKPIISYFDTSALKLARLVEGKWKFEVVDKFPRLDQWGWRFFRSRVVIDSKGRPHIGYESPLGLKHAWWDGQRWKSRVILAPTGTFFDGGMTMDESDNIYFSYTDPVQGTLMLAIGRMSEHQQDVQARSSNVPGNDR